MLTTSVVENILERLPALTIGVLGDLFLDDLEEALGRKVDVIEIRYPNRATERIQREAVLL